MKIALSFFLLRLSYWLISVAVRLAPKPVAMFFKLKARSLTRGAELIDIIEEAEEGLDVE